MRFAKCICETGKEWGWSICETRVEKHHCCEGSMHELQTTLSTQANQGQSQSRVKEAFRAGLTRETPLNSTEPAERLAASSLRSQCAHWTLQGNCPFLSTTLQKPRFQSGQFYFVCLPENDIKQWNEKLRIWIWYKDFGMDAKPDVK